MSRSSSRSRSRSPRQKYRSYSRSRSSSPFTPTLEDVSKQRAKAQHTMYDNEWVWFNINCF